MRSSKTQFDKSGIKQATSEEITNVKDLLESQIKFTEANGDQLKVKKLNKIIHQCYELLQRLKSLDPPEKTTYILKLITFLKHCKSKNEHKLIQQTTDNYLNTLEKMLEPIQRDDF